MIQEKVNQFLSIAAIGAGAAARMGSEAISKAAQAAQPTAARIAERGLEFGDAAEPPEQAALTQDIYKSYSKALSGIEQDPRATLIGQSKQRRTIDKFNSQWRKDQMRVRTL